MKRTLPALLLLLCLVPPGTWGADTSKTGILTDVTCGPSTAADEQKAAKHKVACALHCKDGGFGMVTEGKFLKFDEAGNRKALEVFEKTKKKSDVRVKVTGDFSTDTVKVGAIEEIN
jgi:hypothetical protein